MLPLKSPRWSDELTHAFGSAHETPIVIQELYDCLDAEHLDDDRYKVALRHVNDEIENMFHQCNVCTAAGAAVPHLLHLASRLKLDDQIEMYFVLAWMHSEGAGMWIKDLEAWYDQAIEKAKSEIVALARSSNRLTEDQQFYLFIGLDGLHEEHYMQAIRHRWQPEFGCRQCDERLELDWSKDGYRLTAPVKTLETEEPVVCSNPSFEQLFRDDDYKAFVFKIATTGGHNEFANWLGMMHTPFACPVCNKPTTILAS